MRHFRTTRRSGCAVVLLASFGAMLWSAWRYDLWWWNNGQRVRSVALYHRQLIFLRSVPQAGYYTDKFPTAHLSSEADEVYSFAGVWAFYVPGVYGGPGPRPQTILAQTTHWHFLGAQSTTIVRVCETSFVRFV